MPTIDVRRAHSLGLEGARAAAEKVAKRLEEKAQVRSRWQGDDLVFERTGAKGRIAVTSDEVRVVIELGLVLRPMRGQVERKVQEYLERYLVAD